MPRRQFSLGPAGRCVVVFAVAAFLGLSNGCGKKSAEKKKPGEVPESAVTVALRVSAKDLQGLLDEKSVRILDVRDEESYASGHVPGAVRVDLGKWKATALENDGKGLTDKAAWEKLVRDAGINNLTQIVVYSDSPTNAARIWWTLKYLGVEQAGILDGGWKAWTAEKGKTSTETAKVETGDFTVEFNPKRLAVIDELKQEGEADKLQIVDARTDREFNLGKIGTAVHLNWTNLMAEDGKLKPTDELKKIFAASKLDAEKTAVTYCQSGGRAALNAYALEVAGFKDVKNYYCSWSQWSKQTPTTKSKTKEKAKPKGEKPKS